MPTVIVPRICSVRRLRHRLVCAGLAAALGGCASNSGALSVTDGGATNAAIVKVADPVVSVTPGIETAKAKGHDQGIGGFGGKKPSSEPVSLMPQIGPKVAARGANEAYQLTADELKLDCKKITGKMQVRILQVRDQREQSLTSTTAQTIQRTIVPVLGGSPHGANPNDDFKRDRAWLEAFNARLTEKSCPAYNLEAELQPRSIRDTPKPVPSAEGTKSAKK
jgi:hypothetical protein